ncbi:MAG: flagellar basal-body MS-ring/collar protein FliF, partial [Pyrinomonadaceae bacterium]
MPNSFKQFAELWGRMKNGQRAAVIGGAAATLALLGALVYYSSQPEYGVLFADLKPADAQGIVEKLKAANVPYQLNSGGTAVSVPSERISELRLQIASSGALSGGHVGFDIFDRNSFGATDFAQQVNYQRALEGELARTLEGMDEVESARVHITRPQESLFADKEQRAKASVVLRIRQSRELARERTEAVINLVSSAVEGLDTADVSVMDARGRLLSAPTRAGSLADAGAFNSHLEARRRFEAETAARIISMLEPVTGAGHVRADVAADIDFSHVDQTEEKFNPQSAVIRSQQTSQEVKTNGTNAGPAGIVGARANDPAAQALAAAAQPAPQVNLNPSQPGAQRAATTTNYEIDRTVRHTVGGGGNLTRLSVSVMVDYKIVNGVATTRTPVELQKILQL